MYYVKRIIGFLNAVIGKGMFKRNAYNLSSLVKRLVILPFWYVLTLIFAVLDLFLLGDLITILLKIFSRSTRKLSKDELEKLGILTTNDLLFLESVTIIEESWLSKLGCWIGRRKSLGLGVGRTVHFSRKIDPTKSSDLRWLMHELAHTLQFKYRGLIYIPEALIAQHFSGYDFGGKQSLDEQSAMTTFNPEQQAEIFRYLILSKYPSKLRKEIINGNW